MTIQIFIECTNGSYSTLNSVITSDSEIDTFNSNSNDFIISHYGYFDTVYRIGSFNNYKVHDIRVKYDPSYQKPIVELFIMDDLGVSCWTPESDIIPRPAISNSAPIGLKLDLKLELGSIIADTHNNDLYEVESIMSMSSTSTFVSFKNINNPKAGMSFSVSSLDLDEFEKDFPQYRACRLKLGDRALLKNHMDVFIIDSIIFKNNLFYIRGASSITSKQSNYEVESDWSNWPISNSCSMGIDFAFQPETQPEVKAECPCAHSRKYLNKFQTFSYWYCPDCKKEVV
jgi:hypothetical protein